MTLPGREEEEHGTAALRMAERGGLDVQTILDIRNAEFDDLDISGDQPLP